VGSLGKKLWSLKRCKADYKPPQTERWEQNRDTEFSGAWKTGGGYRDNVEGPEGKSQGYLKGEKTSIVSTVNRGEKEQAMTLKPSW